MADGEARRRGTAIPGRLTAEEVVGRGFASAFRGISETEVRNFLRRVAEDLTALRERDAALSDRIGELETELATPPQLTDEQLFDALGQETTRVLRSAQEAAESIRAHALAAATELTDEAEGHDRHVREQVERFADERRNEVEATTAERERASIGAADTTRADSQREAVEIAERAVADAAAEVERGRESGRAMVEEARRVRERVLSDLARRRALMEAQLAELRTGRDRLMGAYRVVKETLADATTALADVQARAHATDGVEIEPVPEVPGIDADTEAVGDASADAPVDEVADAASGDESHAVEPEAPSTGAEPGEPGVPEVSSPADGAIPGSVAAVDALFARLKEERVDGASTPEPGPTLDLAKEGAEAESAVEPPDGSEAAPAGGKRARGRRGRNRSGAEPAPGEPPEIAARDVAIDKARTALARRAKRALQDEQNEVLDALRRHKGTPTADALLPSPEARAEAWADVLEPAIDEIYRAAGRSVAGSGGGVPPGIARATLVELAIGFAAPLHERVEAAFTSADASDEDVTQRLGARYREWRTQQLADALVEVLSAAWVRGSLDAAPPDARLHWITPVRGCCPDCDDDALEPTKRGEAFPTGKLSPPAHPGCRCVLGIAAVEAAATRPS
ncbi:MAG TPA: DivIVA domain-containing protein [Acidimicrobiia bacterium]|nr:DivIVA domain-containing protein [Acidimicrobiia bacterium]